MNAQPGRVVHATWVLMLTLQTIGSVDMKHKLPAPKQYVAINAVWGILFLLVDTGLGKVAARLSVLVLLTASVLGPFGRRFVQFLEAVSARFAIAPPAGTGAGASASAPGAGFDVGTA